MPPEDPRIEFLQTAPILRIFDVAKAKEFYLEFLGFSLSWEHQFDDVQPVYMEVARAGLTLHLSEHYGDACPGSTVFVRMRGVEAFHAELTAKRYGYFRPGLERDGDRRYMEVIDPFGNRIRFSEEAASGLE